MAVSIEELESFHDFVSEKLNNGGSELEWEDLFRLWQLENPTDAERTAVNAIIRQGDKDIESGRGQQADEFNEDLQRKYKLSAE